MTVDITVPALGESVTEATVMRWLKAPGDTVAPDEPLVELETDKVAVEVTAEAAGTLAEITAAEGTDVAVGALLGRLAPESSVALGTVPARESSDALGTVPARESSDALGARRFPPERLCPRPTHLRGARLRGASHLPRTGRFPPVRYRRPRPPCAVFSKSTASTRPRSQAAAGTAAC